MYLNEQKMTDAGASRSYSWQLAASRRMEEIVVRVEITRNGKLVRQSKKATVHSGDSSRVSFDFGKAETSITLNVPKDATVYLAGRKASGAGAIRQFRTTKLALGQRWPDYSIRVTVERNGKVLSKEQRILLTSGEAKTLTFSFDDSLVAATD